eukprot:3140055-Lingulodinium_polyedra.AAC.1
MPIDVVKQCHLPDPIVLVPSVLEANFELADDRALPYDVLDSVRIHHPIDLAGFNVSMTRLGNMY